MKVLQKKIQVFIGAASALFLLPGPVQAAQQKLGDALNNVKKSGNRAGTGGMSDFGTVIGTAIQVALSLVGLIFLVSMIYAGFLWMTARGDEEQVKKSRTIILGSLIGLVIVISAYAISLLVGGNFS